MTLMPQPFNNPSTYVGHSGVDYGQPNGKDIFASGDGVVVHAGYWNSKAGYATVIDYPDCRVLYCHQLEKTVRPAKGSTVRQGSYLGEVGSTGHSTGPHLHMEILIGNGAGTYAGIWNYFDKNRVVGDGSTTGDGDEITPEIKEDEMKNCAAFWFNGDGKTLTVLVYNTESKWYHSWITDIQDGGYNEQQRKAMNCGEIIGEITKSHAGVLLASLNAPSLIELKSAVVPTAK